MKKKSLPHTNETPFPKTKDGRPDFTAYWKLKKNERSEASNWLLKHGTDVEKEDFNNLINDVNQAMASSQRREARLNQQEENLSKHSRKRNKKGGCSIQ